MRRALFILGAIVLCVCATGAWLVATESGLRFVFARVATVIPGTLSAQRLAGRLLGPVRAEGLKYSDATVDVAVRELELDWRPAALWQQKFVVQSLTASGIDIALRETGTDAPPGATPALPPLVVDLTSVELHDVQFRNGGRAPLVVESVAFVARVEPPGTIAIESLSARLFGGTLEGQGHGQWQPTLGATFTIAARGLNPGVQWPDWPGKLDLSAQAAVETRPTGLHGEVSVTDLRGVLRDAAVSAHMRARIDGAQYEAIDVGARMGRATFALTGRVTERFDLAWRLHVPDLGRVLPDAGGRVEATGKLSGPRVQARLAARIDGRHVRHRDRRVAQLNGDLALDLSNRAASRAHIIADDIVIADRHITHISLNVDGTATTHAIGARIRMPGLSLDTNADGSYVKDTWRGNLHDAALKTTAAGNWTLVQSGPFVLTHTALEVGPLCLQAAPAHICADGRGTWSDLLVTTSLKHVPLALLDPWLEPDYALTGQATGEARVQWTAGQIKSGGGEFEISPGTFTDVARALSFDYQRATFEARIADDLQAHGEIALAGNDVVAVRLKLPQFGGGVNQPLNGTVEATFTNLALLHVLIPVLEPHRATLRAQLTLAGTLAEPRARGRIDLTDAAARVPTLGIEITDLAITAEVSGGTELRLTGRARSNEGTLTATGTLDLAQPERWRAQVAFTGERVEIFNTSETHVLASSSDLRLRVTPGRLDVDGTVHIPQARFAPHQPSGHVTTSSDVVIVNTLFAPEAQTPWEINTAIRFTLGEQVNFEGFGLRGRVSGALTVRDTPSGVTTASGELRINDGQYEAYGQRLTVERGRLLFAGGPIDNPGIDARAVRVLPDVRAGVLVSGTLKTPELRLFSDPAMSQEDALSYLLFGQPFEAATTAEGQALAGAARALELAGGDLMAKRIGTRLGFDQAEIQSGTKPNDAALVFAKRLSPRLYLKYSIGLFEQINTVRLRYQLGRRWILQAESGAHTGADLLYTIER